MDKLRLEVLKEEHWNTTYDKLTTKKHISAVDKGELMNCNIQREEIVNQLFNGTYNWSIPQKVLIAKSGTKKKRVVFIYNLRDRYILGVLYRAFSNYFSKQMNSHCFSYKTGVSTNTAIHYLKYQLNDDFKVGVKIDIQSYFNSVSRDRVKQMLDELFSDGIKTTLEKLMLDDTVEFQGEQIQEWKALIAGCALGSFFANYCLAPLDAELESKGVVFARYSDDIIILGNNKKQLKEYLDIVRKHLANYGLEINPKKYKWFEESDDFDFLGLKLSKDGTVDISDHAKKKIKRQIKRWCDKGRKDMEMNYKDFYTVASKIMKRLNNKNFKCYINNDATFGWCHYAFRYITTIDSLKEIDLYCKDTLRAMKTGKHNKANYKALDEQDFRDIGWVSLVQLYHLYKKDFDYYCEVIELI